MHHRASLVSKAVRLKMHYGPRRDGPGFPAIPRSGRDQKPFPKPAKRGTKWLNSLQHLCLCSISGSGRRPCRSITHASRVTAGRPVPTNPSLIHRKPYDPRRTRDLPEGVRGESGFFQDAAYGRNQNEQVVLIFLQCSSKKGEPPRDA